MTIRLQEALRQDGEDPDSILFEVEEEKPNSGIDMETMLKQMMCMLEEQKWSLVQNALEEHKHYLEAFKNALEPKFEIIERNIDNVENNMAILEMKVGSQFENIETRFKKQMEDLAEELGNVRKHKLGDTDCPRRKEMHPPTFDGQAPWPIYRKQLEAVAMTNHWDDEDKTIALTSKGESSRSGN